MYSVIVDGKVLDFKYKQTKHPKLKYRYVFYIGDILIGQLFNHGRRGWSCVSDYKSNPLCPVNGFKTRHDAAEFLLKLNGFHENT